jgi:signal transduction histidine kinase/ActR/RegA family two-component response regulator
MTQTVNSIDLEQRLLHEQVSILLNHLPGVVVGTVVLACGAAWLLILQNLPTLPVLGWLAGMALYSMLRLTLLLGRRRYPPAGANLRRWAWVLTAASAGAGAMWGLIPWLFFVPDNLYAQAVIAIALGGILASANQSIGAYWPAHLAFDIPCSLPFSIQCLITGESASITLGVLSLLFLVFSASFARSIPQSLRQSIALRMENEALVQSLTRAKEHAEASERRKTRFLAAASHDLRQPIHAMGLFVPALQRLVRHARPSPHALADIADRMNSVLESMGQLLHVLMISRLDSGAVTVRRAPCALNPVLQQVCEVLREQAKAKGLRLQLVETRLWARADPAVLHTVLLNLVANAVRYCEHGGVLVGARRRGGEVQIQVWDTGIGIPEQDLPRVFDEFYQARNAHRTSAQTRGFGLGLSIVQRSAELLDARLNVHSRLGRGSVFSVFLMRCDPEATAPALRRKPAPTTSGQVVLVLDNDEQVVRALTHLLTGLGHTVLGAQAMREALVLTWNNSASISLIVADYHLSETFDGLQAISRLRGILEREVPALIITGDASVHLTDDDVSQNITLLNKPVDPRALQRWMNEATPSTAAID